MQMPAATNEGTDVPAPTTPSRTDLETALMERYGEPVAAGAVRHNPTLACLLSHRSVRSFLPDPLPEGTLEVLVAAAQSAPTSSNVQAFSVVAVTEPERKARLAALADNQKFILRAPLLLLWVADLARSHGVGARAGQTMEALDYLECFLLASVDAALGAQNAVVAAESMGLGTVYVGAMRNHPAEVAAEIGLPPRSFVVTGLAVGHPDPAVATAVKPRLPQAAVLHRERYSDVAVPAAVDRHDATTTAFRVAQGLSPVGWSALLRQRLGHLDAMKGRHRLRQILAGLGLSIK